eukprot:UN02662
MYVTQGPSGQLTSYMMAKVEGEDEQYHGHVSAVTVAPSSRRLGLGSLLMVETERTLESTYDTNYCDLYVRPSNISAVMLYKKLGYEVCRRVLAYYSGEEDAYDMRKALRRMIRCGKKLLVDKQPTKPTSYDTG